MQTMIQAKVNFRLQTFQLPDASITKIESVCANFIWKGGLYKIKYHNLCRPKNEKEVGLRNLREMRDAFTMEQEGKIINSNGLWAKWMR